MISQTSEHNWPCLGPNRSNYRGQHDAGRQAHYNYKQDSARVALLAILCLLWEEMILMHLAMLSVGQHGSVIVRIRSKYLFSKVMEVTGPLLFLCWDWDTNLKSVQSPTWPPTSLEMLCIFLLSCFSFFLDFTVIPFGHINKGWFIFDKITQRIVSTHCSLVWLRVKNRMKMEKQSFVVYKSA